MLPRRIKTEIDERALFVSQQQSEILYYFSNRNTPQKSYSEIQRRFKECQHSGNGRLGRSFKQEGQQHLPSKHPLLSDTPEHLYDALVELEQDIESLLLDNGTIHKIKAKDINTQLL